MASKYGLDKFYTKKELAKKLIDIVGVNKYDILIEPSAGNGSFSSQIEGCIAYDLQPEHGDIIEQDYLKLDLQFKEEDKVLVIGNPPFGRNGSLALAFIKHSCNFADTIAFILPKSFKKDFFYYKIPLNFWKTKEIEIEDSFFIYEGESIEIPCVFQIFEKREKPREKQKKIIPKTFSFVKKDEANCSIRRVGVYAGKAYLDTNKSEQSHYFINVENPDDFVNTVNKIEWEHNNTVGPRSIGKSELINAIEGC